MRITEQQEATLNALSCLRVDAGNAPLLQSIVSPTINGQTVQIADIFRKETELEANYHNEVASYIVTKCDDETHKIVLLFFSLRCGELYRQGFTKEQIRRARNFLRSLKQLLDIKRHFLQKDTHSLAGAIYEYLQKLRYRFLLSKVQKANTQGLSQELASKIVNYADGLKQEKLQEGTKDIHRVQEVFPGIELKLFGINDKAKNEIWPQLDMPRSMGETLFWKFVIPKVNEIIQQIGAKYLYLFAADNSEDERLVEYYKNRLCFSGDEELAANKPSFDFSCDFLYQSINTLLRQQEKFFETFTLNQDNLV